MTEQLPTEARTAVAERIRQLVAVGGKEWCKVSRHRVYFDNLPAWYGLTFTVYNTGNVQSAKLAGVRISNSQAKKLLLDLEDGKLWWDVLTERWQYAFGYIRGEAADYAATVIAAIESRVTQDAVPARAASTPQEEA